MKIRYYLRGLGLGILFTAAFFILCVDSKQTMSDEMIKARAKELGMIENTVLADIGESSATAEEPTDDVEKETAEEVESSVEEATAETEEATETAESTEEVESSEEEASVEEPDSKEQPVEEEAEEPSKEEGSSQEEPSQAAEETQAPADGQIISIVVNKGEGSDTVSQRLYQAGLVDDPYAYDKYLMQNGYDRRIGAGEHLIPSGSSWQEIAVLLCR